MNTQAFSLEGLVWGLGFGRLDLSATAYLSPDRFTPYSVGRQKGGLGCRGKGL